MTLNPKQQRFVEEYLKDLNATQAAIRAGYSPKTAEVQGCRLLRNAQIRDRVTKRQAARAERTEITQDRVLRELAALGFIEVGSLMDGGNLLALEDLPEEVRRGIAGMEIVTKQLGKGEVEHIAKVKLEKVASLTLLARHLGMLNDKLNLKDETIDVTQLSDATLQAIHDDLAKGKRG